MEDSRDNIWLVNIITKPKTNDNSACNRSKFLKTSTWNKLNSLSKLGILTGTFHCDNDPRFCELKGWNKPKLVLGLVKYNPNRYPKEFVELVYYDDCHLNKFEHVFSWIESTLRNKLIKKLDLSKNVNNHMEEDRNMLKLFYVESPNKKLPLYYSALSVKHNKRTSFYYVKNYEKYSNIFSLNNKNKEQELFANLCLKEGFKSKLNFENSNTRIFIIIDDKLCYNYGTNINELPNYPNLNQFLVFLSPDINNIFLVTFILLNIYLVMFFFDYKKSFLKQIGRGLFYLCIFNSVLFSIWLLTMNANSRSSLTSFPNLYLNKFLILFRFLMFSNELAQSLFSKLRFFLFFYLYIKPVLAFLIYFFVILLFYFHKRFIHLKNADKFEKKIKLNKKLNSITSDSSLLPLKNSTKASNLAQKKSNNKPSSDLKKQEINNQTNGNSVSTTAAATTTSIASSTLNTNERQVQSVVAEASNSNSLFNQNPIDIDVEIGVYELINQINGLTTIWLQSTTQADRLISELPSIEFCKCFYAHTIKIRALDETDRDETTTEDDEEPVGMSNGCECGKNRDLKNFLVDKNKFRRECSICLEKYKFGNSLTFLECGHLFHRKCIYEWFMNSVNYDLKCPVCRTSFYKFKKTL